MALIHGKDTTSHTPDVFICEMVGCGTHPASENCGSRKAFVNRSRPSERVSQHPKCVENPRGTPVRSPVSQALGEHSVRSQVGWGVARPSSHRQSRPESKEEPTVGPEDQSLTFYSTCKVTSPQAPRHPSRTLAVLLTWRRRAGSGSSGGRARPTAGVWKTLAQRMV